MKLRPATSQDAELLLEWRNDPLTRRASHNTEKIEQEEHQLWLKRVLRDPQRKLFIAEEEGVPVGTVRADYSDGIYELSWTVAPNARGRGVGKRMVALLAKQISAPIRAEIKLGNVASARIAEYAGMVFDREANGVWHYHREALR